MPSHRRKPKPVDAFQFTGQKRNQWPNWAKNNTKIVVISEDDGVDETLRDPEVASVEGRKICRSGDWIIQEEDDSLRVIPNSMFTADFEEDN